VYHVYSRGNNRELIYRQDDDCRLYLRLLGLLVKRRRWRCLAYCLMHNHVHLLVETPEADIAAGMQWLHGLYARTLNERYDRVGHVFQGRYGAVRVRSDAQLFAVVRYLALNPVEASFCDHPEDYPWSSYGGVLAASAPAFLDVKRLLGYFAAATAADSRTRYRDLVSPPRSSP
jgi:REP-associated tyrosine transposase